MIFSKKQVNGGLIMESNEHSIKLVIEEFKVIFSWREGNPWIDIERRCNECNQSFDEKNGCHHIGNYIICNLCGRSYFFNRRIKERFWEKVSSIEEELFKAIRKKPNLDKEEALSLAKGVLNQ